MTAKLSWLFMLLAAFLAAQQTPKTGMKLGDFNLHDPFVLVHQPTHTYYLYNGAPRALTGGTADGVAVYKSKDLDTWDGPYSVFVIPQGIWANPTHGAWAPEVHEYKGNSIFSSPCTTGTQPSPTHRRRSCVPFTRGSTRRITFEGPRFAWRILRTARSRCWDRRWRRPRIS